MSKFGKAGHNITDREKEQRREPDGSARPLAPFVKGGRALAGVLGVLLVVAPAACALAGGALDLRPELALPATAVVESAGTQDPYRSGGVMLLAQTVVTQGRPVDAKQEEAEDGYKSPGKAFIFSALAPGTGQLYVGAKRGYIYLGVEAVAWATSYFFHESGTQKEDEYMDFADNHWHFPELGAIVGVAGDGSVIYYDQEHKDRIEYFYENDKGHFYEDIGKYAYYTIGWDPGTLDDYLDMRDDANRLLKNSDYAIMAVVVNHVVSAVDALRLARSHNVNLGYGVNLNLKFKGSLHSGGVMLVASRKF